MTIALSMIILSCVIALGKLLGRFKIWGVSFGVTWVLFIGIVFAHFGYNLNPEILHFMKEFGLILFVYSIGMQVGPSFFSSFMSGGIRLNCLATLVVILGAVVTLALIEITGIDAPTMIGVMSGAVTNTPGLGAAQQTFTDVTGLDSSNIALGYAVAYPLGVVGCIASFILLKFILFKKEDAVVPQSTAPSQDAAEVHTGAVIQKKIIVSKRKINGLQLAKLEFDKYLGANVVKIRRAGVEISVSPETRLQLGDVVTVSGTKSSAEAMEKVLGNSLKKLDHPNLFAIFAGIAFGCFLGSIPFHIPGIPQPIKLGLAGGPLIVSILISYFGPRFKMITYSTTSANLMIREIGISLFLACVGLQAGDGFVDSIVNKGGCMWILYGAIITIIPLLLSGAVGKLLMRMKYTTLIGVLAGATTNPPALAYASDQDKNNDAAAVGYATVYPLTMFLRVLVAQLLILFVI